MPLPHLLHFRVSHYNEKVRWALDFKGVAHTRESLVPGFHLPRVRALTGQSQLPVLVLDGRPLLGSAAIIEALDRRYPDRPLIPFEPVLRTRALALEAWLDGDVAPILRRLFWSTYLDRPGDAARMATAGASRVIRWLWRLTFPLMRPLFRRNMGIQHGDVERARAAVPALCDRLAAEIGPSGFLVGDVFTVSDLTAAAVMTAILRPPEFPYPLPEPWPPALVAMREAMASHAASRWAMDLYATRRSVSCEVRPPDP